VLAVLFYAYTGVAVAIARGKYKIAPPATTGHPDFERVFRVQMNTLEWMPIFLPLLWLCAFYIGDAWAAGLGLVWILGRALYSAGYTAAADKREWGFRMQASACAVLLIADIVAIGARLFQGH
jgi:glutathione S-transferase